MMARSPDGCAAGPRADALRSDAVARRQTQARTLAEIGELIVETDPRRPSGRLLRQAEMDASYIDLADATHLEFDYMRWLRLTLRAARARRVLHIGGGGCALARALLAEDPGSRQQVCELDPDVLAIAREHLGLRRLPGLRVRNDDGRAHLAAQPEESWDAIVIDAFVGAHVPESLVSSEALADAARVAPMTLVNVIDDRSAGTVGAIAATMADAYPCVWLLGHGAGNTIVAGATAERRPDLDVLSAHAAADPSPARLTSRGR
jgi:hypothetical protein